MHLIFYAIMQLFLYIYVAVTLIFKIFNLSVFQVLHLGNIKQQIHTNFG